MLPIRGLCSHDLRPDQFIFNHARENISKIKDIVSKVLIRAVSTELTFETEQSQAFLKQMTGFKLRGKVTNTHAPCQSMFSVNHTINTD